MATWTHTEINIDGRIVKAQAPMIVSASRSTDIPAFMQTGSFIDWRKDIQRGQIHSMARKVTCRIRTHALLCFGLRIQRS